MATDIPPQYKYILLCPHEDCRYVSQSVNEVSSLQALKYHLTRKHFGRLSPDDDTGDLTGYIETQITRVETGTSSRKRQREEVESPRCQPKERRLPDPGSLDTRDAHTKLTEQRILLIVADLYDSELKFVKHHFLRLYNDRDMVPLFCGPAHYPERNRWLKPMTDVYIAFRNYRMLREVESFQTMCQTWTKTFAAMVVPLLPPQTHRMLETSGPAEMVHIICQLLNSLPDEHPFRAFIRAKYLEQRVTLQLLMRDVPDQEHFLWLFADAKTSPRVQGTQCQRCSYILDGENTCPLCTFYPMFLLRDIGL